MEELSAPQVINKKHREWIISACPRAKYHLPKKGRIPISSFTHWNFYFWLNVTNFPWNERANTRTLSALTLSHCSPLERQRCRREAPRSEQLNPFLEDLPQIWAVLPSFKAFPLSSPPFVHSWLPVLTPTVCSGTSWGIFRSKYLRWKS